MKTLYDAFGLIENKQEFDAFMRDLCTPNEIRNLKERWRIAQILHSEKKPHAEIARELKSGVSTITRVARCLHIDKNGGYRTILKRIRTSRKTTAQHLPAIKH